MESMMVSPEGRDTRGVYVSAYPMLRDSTLAKESESQRYGLQPAWEKRNDDRKVEVGMGKKRGSGTGRVRIARHVRAVI
jgi:hypothetical protein